MQGLVFNTQRFSVHDGPGIRTTIFLQGCPLRCRWCANPESWEKTPVIMVRNAKCIRCGRCAEACTDGAVTVTEHESRQVDFAQCTHCGQCALACPTQSISMSSRSMTVDEVTAVARRDKLFYKNSGGGVTISGGEPTQQADFVECLLQSLHEENFHVALDTCGQARWKDLERLAKNADLVLFDIKHMDSDEHRRGTSLGNERILDNAAKLAAMARVWLRLPLLGGYNDSEENVARVAAFAKRIGAEKVSLLPYHQWGEDKYAQLGLRYDWQGEVPDEERVRKLEGILRDAGLETGVGR